MENNKNGKAIASMVLGIVGLVFVFFGYFAFIGIVAAIVGLILGIMAKKQQPSGMATAGIVLSIIALALCAITFIACVWPASAALRQTRPFIIKRLPVKLNSAAV